MEVRTWAGANWLGNKPAAPSLPGTFTFDIRDVQVSPAAGSVFGGRTLTLGGVGIASGVKEMPVELTAPDWDAPVPCEVKSTDLTSVECATPPSLRAGDLMGTSTETASFVFSVDAMASASPPRALRDMDNRYTCNAGSDAKRAKAVNCLTGGFDPAIAAALTTRTGIAHICEPTCAYEWAGKQLRHQSHVNNPTITTHCDDELFLDDPEIAAWMGDVGGTTIVGSRSGRSPRFRAPYPLPLGPPHGGWRLESGQYTGLWLDVGNSDNFEDATGGPAPACLGGVCPDIVDQKYLDFAPENAGLDLGWAAPLVAVTTAAGDSAEESVEE